MQICIQSQSWHPSKQHDFRNEAICIYNLTESICFSKVIAKVNAVPTRNQ